MDKKASNEFSDASNAAKRIRELNDINQTVPEILNSARAVMIALSAASDTDASSSTYDISRTDKRKEAFAAATRQYFSLVLNVQEGLQAQTQALEDAGIIASKAEDQGEGRHISLGQLDVGWLNERRGDVGRGFEGELMSEARAVVEKLLKEKYGANDYKMIGT